MDKKALLAAASLSVKGNFRLFLQLTGVGYLRFRCLFIRTLSRERRHYLYCINNRDINVAFFQFVNTEMSTLINDDT